ncbi:hypothetical protein SLEP1_g16110 [Rubroshorea leprosula]|uniref:Secreted protein n=1 Tax=Rubroshorea leprosula TaxID=152421 RepID=A0AAV5IVM2_9ROSI|nr:hypothetical protein SLEP1_g16110 [Rubroshorea leprosula]
MLLVTLLVGEFINASTCRHMSICFSHVGTCRYVIRDPACGGYTPANSDPTCGDYTPANGVPASGC